MEDTLVSGLALFDLLDNSVRRISIQRRPACDLCGDNPTITDLKETVSTCGTGSKQPSVSPDDLLVSRDEWVIFDLRADHLRKSYPVPDSRPVSLLTVDDAVARRTEERAAVMCQEGRRSEAVVRGLIERGFREVYHLREGALGLLEALGNRNGQENQSNA